MTTHSTIHRSRRPDRQRPFPRPAPLIAATVLTLFSAPLAAAAATRWVNDNAASYVAPGSSCNRPGYATIQGAVSAASASDVIRVCPGKYVENVVVPTSNLTIVSTTGVSATMVKAAASTYVFQLLATGLTIRGFTIVPAGSADGDIGINVAIDGETGLSLLDSVIFGGRIGINLGCVTFGSVVAQNVLNGQTDAAINIDTCEAPPFPGSHDNSIHHNIACNVAATASIALGGASDHNRIQYNVATTISVFGSSNVVRYNTTQVAIVDNGAGSVLNNNLVDAGVCPTTP